MCWNCYYQALTDYKYYSFSRDESFLNFKDKYIQEKDKKHRKKLNTTCFLSLFAGTGEAIMPNDDREEL